MRTLIATLLVLAFGACRASTSTMETGSTTAAGGKKAVAGDTPVALVSAADARQAAALRQTLGPSEILARMEASPVNYVIAEVPSTDPRELADRLWPRVGQLLRMPRVVIDANGTRSVVAWPIDPETERLTDLADVDFKAKHWDAAKVGFLAAAARTPDYYIAVLFAGDADLEAGRPTDALAAYQRAAEINPYDYRTHFFQATALRRLDRMDEHRAQVIETLLHNPRYPGAVKMLGCCAAEVSIDADVEPLKPKVAVERTEQGARIEWNAHSGPHWLAYGQCKAYWLAERRQAMGVDKDTWTTGEEAECLANLNAVYKANRGAAYVLPEAGLDRLLAASEADLLIAFVHYEVGARMDPHLTLRLPDQDRAAVREYLRKLVIMPPAVEPRPKAPKSAPPGLRRWEPSQAPA